MKKKIAVFANGLNDENLMKYLDGIKDTCPVGFADFHVFLSHDSFGNKEEVNRAEWSIFNLPNLKDYDGAILFAPGMNFSEINDVIIKNCLNANIPVICISAEYEGTVRIYTDNYSGMKLVIDHLIDEHKVENILFIAGPEDNAESNDRLRAVKDSLADNNISFGENNIFYSNWIAYRATDFIKERYYSKQGLPDAIVCANDTTAFFICLVLEDLGVKCPEDVIVTGFDGTYRAMTFYPSITTVVQPFYEMGVKSAECFNKMFAGEVVESEYYIPCTFRRAESCGCDTAKEFDGYRKRFSIKTYRNEVVTDFNLFRIKGLTDAMLRSESYSAIDKHLQEFFYSSDGFEGNPFYICMDPMIATLGENETDRLPEYTINDSLYMLVGKDGDEKYSTVAFNIKDTLIPRYSNNDKNHIYVFMPTYYKSFVFGYVVMCDRNDYFGDNTYQFFQVNFNRLIEPYRKNMQLTELNAKLSQLMNKDVLTSTKNRMAFETYREKLLQQVSQNPDIKLSFVMADINNLKKINDTLGHECGDEYIKNSSSLICSTFKSSPVFRMGGDEFVVVLQGKDYERRDALMGELSDTMASLANNENDPLKRVSIAFGIVDYNPEIDISIDDTLKRADELMYENKRNYKLRSI